MSQNFYTKIERYGNDILWIGYEDGERFYRKVKYQPTFYVDTKSEDSTMVSLIGERPLKPITCESMKGATDFLSRYQDVQNMSICGNVNHVAAFTYDHYPGHIDFDPSLIHLFMFDIEVDISEKKPNMELADNPITSIASKSSKSDTYQLFGLKDYDRTLTETDINPDKIKFTKFNSERDLLLAFVKLWAGDFPDVVTGYNVELFDIAYIVKRIEVVLGATCVKKLSPWGIVRERTFEMFGKPQKTYVINGISIVDYMNTFKKFGYKYGTMQSYKLDNVANVVLGTKKLSYEDPFGNTMEMHRFITDGAKGVRVPKNAPKEKLDRRTKLVWIRDRLREEKERRSL